MLTTSHWLSYRRGVGLILGIRRKLRCGVQPSVRPGGLILFAFVCKLSLKCVYYFLLRLNCLN
jgi:hypothetical protein